MDLRGVRYVCNDVRVWVRFGVDELVCWEDGCFRGVVLLDISALLAFRFRCRVEVEVEELALASGFPIPREGGGGEGRFRRTGVGVVGYSESGIARGVLRDGPA